MLKAKREINYCRSYAQSRSMWLPDEFVKLK